MTTRNGSKTFNEIIKPSNKKRKPLPNLIYSDGQVEIRVEKTKTTTVVKREKKTLGEKRGEQ